MIRITQLKLSIKHNENDLKKAVSKILRINPDRIHDYTIIRKSIDARKNEIKYIYTIDLSIALKSDESEATLIIKCKNSNVSIAKTNAYHILPSGLHKLSKRPIVVGSGPSGLFVAYLLAKHGYQPLVLERGYEVTKRVEAVEHFWNTNQLNTESNVQFGEGGAGTFSDGKLNTLVKDIHGRYGLVMETFTSFGAPSEILYLNKPHIGTDKLRLVVENMRKEIIRLGGEVQFGTALTDLVIENQKLIAIEVNHSDVIPCEILIPAIGHSARDTFDMFYKRGLELSAKAFAIGLRIEHKQRLISEAQYGKDFIHLPAADYKLTHQTSLRRGVYSFCMCPGGFVVNASSELGHLAVNGMSNYKRDEINANSAIVVTVHPEDFGSNHPLGGIEFQRQWERAAYQTGNGLVPIQLLGDLINNRKSTSIGEIKPNIKGGYHLTDLNQCLPPIVIDSVKEGILAFDKKIHGFAREDAILAGVESRTSSPVRIHRDENLESNMKGIYPCGEGAGYAGGITSAAIDGIKVFESIAKKYKPTII